MCHNVVFGDFSRDEPELHVFFENRIIFLGNKPQAERDILSIFSFLYIYIII